MRILHYYTKTKKIFQSPTQRNKIAKKKIILQVQSCQINNNVKEIAEEQSQSLLLV